MTMKFVVCLMSFALCIIANAFASKIPSGKCILWFGWIMLISYTQSRLKINFITSCRNLKWLKFILQCILGSRDVNTLDAEMKCIPDYAGPCYEDAECCTKHCSNFICRPPSEKRDVQLKEKCIPDYAGPCYEDAECCTENCSNFICRPPSWDDGTSEKEDCIPDYAGPCYEDSECCTNHCSNFICRPPSKAENKSKKEGCIPDYAGPCYEDSECCTGNCSNFICRP